MEGGLLLQPWLSQEDEGFIILGAISWKPPLDGLEFLRWLIRAINGLLMGY